MTHRYAPKHFYDGMSDVPTGWRKRLTNEEKNDSARANCSRAKELNLYKVEKLQDPG